jgi:hypothetical protein
MSPPNEPTKNPQAKAKDSEPVPSRRRLLQGGLAAAPVILTLVSRPVLGGVPCRTCSAFLSGNESGPNANLPICSGRPPSWWERNPSVWSDPYEPRGQKATLFHSATTGCQSGRFGKKTMMQVLNLNSGADYVLGQYICAAFLNAAAGWTPVLDEPRVRNMWNEYVYRGCFEPTAGIQWYADDIVRYIQSTIG